MRANPLLRVWMSSRVRDLLPLPAAVRLALWRGRMAWWLRPGERRDALRWAALMLGGEAPPAEVRALARASVAEHRARRDLGLRDRDVFQAPVEGLQNFERARAPGKGVILLAAHAGPKLPDSAPLTTRGYRVAAVWHRRERLRGRAGLTHLHRMRISEQGGCVPVFRGEAYDAVREILREGDACVMVLDVQGGIETRLLGQPAWLAGGWAHLALETGASVVPLFRWRDGDALVYRLHEPLHPSQERGVEDLHAQGVAVLERELRAHLPQYYPRRPPARPPDGDGTPAWSALRVLNANPLLRVWMSSRLRDLVPPPAAVRLALARGKAAWWLRRGERAHAVNWAAEMLGAQASEAEVRALARASVAERRAGRDLGLRDRDLHDARVEGLESFERALAAGRGVILVAPHAGPKLPITPPLASLGHRVVTVWVERRRVRGRSGLTYRHRLRLAETEGGGVLYLGGAYDAVRSLLLAGDSCLMRIDVAGRMRTQLLGQPAWLSGGWAHLAMETGASVVPAFLWREGNRVVERLHEPLDPSQANGAEDLHGQVVAVLDRELRAHLPEYYPRRPFNRPPE